MKIESLRPIFSYKIKSRSEPDIFRAVEVWKDKGGKIELTCDCLAGSFLKPCFHKKFVKENYLKI